MSDEGKNRRTEEEKKISTLFILNHYFTINQLTENQQKYVIILPIPNTPLLN